MADLIQEILINNTYIRIKFYKTLEASSIVNDAFVVINTTDDEEIIDPFETIILSEDYNSIGRALRLNWNAGTLDQGDEYSLTLTGLRDATGLVLTDETVTFTASESNDSIEEQEEQATPAPVIDFSVIPASFTGNVAASSSDFQVTSTDPENGNYWIDTDYNNGRIIVKFSSEPNPQYVNSTYFKVQKRQVKKAPTRWETIDARYSLSANKPWVYVDFPSTDDTPVYVTADSDYFEPNYKYRVIVSKDVGT